jgi:segregation and condensation protein A
MDHEELVEERPVAPTVPDATPAQEQKPVPDAVSVQEQKPVPDAVSVQEQKPTLVRRPTYEVRLDAFEGPLDLLLHLIREHEIDIYDIPLAIITEQYLEYITFMESLDLALAGEFLEMAATLIRIKVQMLLPKETDAGEEEEDPRQQLVRKLVEYKQFKEVAAALSSKEEERRGHFPRGVDPKSYADLEDEDEVDMAEFLRDVTLFDLVDGLREVLSRVPERVEVHSVNLEEFTVEAQIDHIRAVISERGSIPFTEVFSAGASHAQIIATFMALLELIRLGDVKAVQTRNFGDIEIVARAEE